MIVLIFLLLMLKHTVPKWVIKNIYLVVTLPYLWKTWGKCLSISGENCGLLDEGKFIRETARQLRIDPEIKCRQRWRDRFLSTCEVKYHPCVVDPGWHRQDKRERVRDFKPATFLMRLKVDQMSRTLLFHTHFSQIRYEIKAKTPTHIAKHTELFLCLLFLKYTNFFHGEAKLFWASL